jgi:sugar O-acyltransferase (sialic acid O-acetyltransferase NeuD family)
VVGGLDLVASFVDADVVVCIGNGLARRTVVERLGHLGLSHDRFATIVHPSVDVPEGCSVGPGSILLAHVALTADVTVGRHVVVMPNATLTHDDVLEDFATVCAGVALGGSVRIGEAAYIGMNACVRQRVTVGRDSTLGMGAVLIHDLPPGQVWAGVPAAAIAAVIVGPEPVRRETGS